jgi:uncharacterized protein
MSEPGARGGNRRLAAFFGLTFLWTWGLWIAVALSGADVSASAWAIAYHLGGWAPSLVGVFLLYRTSRDRAERRDFWRRVVDFRRISAGWYVVILLLIPALASVSVFVDALIAGTTPELLMLRDMAANPALLALVAVVGLFVGPISEELGWRGYALDRLQVHWSALASGLALGVVWALWHLPLFFVRGTPQYAAGLGSPFFWMFMGVGLPLSVLMTWAYDHNRRSILSAILLHWAMNFSLNLVYPISDSAFVYYLVLMSLAAAGLVLFVGRGEPGTAS